MNKPSVPRSRPVCSLVRRWEAGCGPASGHSRLLARHLKDCAECREFFAEDPGFEQALRRDAARLRRAPADSGLERGILRAVRNAEEAARKPDRDISPVWGRALLAAAAVAAALALVFWPRPSAGGPGKPAAVAKGPAEETPPRIAVAAGESPRGWWKTLETRGADLAWAEKNPLEQEIESVRTDAQAVVGFLALNFLPTKPRPETPPSQG